MECILMNPVVAMLVNTSTKRFHPILYCECPLPGPPSDSKPIRHKSKGHHTVGFATRDEAVTGAKLLAEQVIKTKCWTSCALALEPEHDLAWDGEDIPADVAFFKIEGTTARRLM